MQGGTAWYGKNASSRRLSDEEQFPDPPLAPITRDRRSSRHPEPSSEPDQFER
jgi:hypothetical protein